MKHYCFAISTGEETTDFVCEPTNNSRYAKFFATSQATSQRLSPIIEIEVRNVAEDTNTFVNSRVGHLVKISELRLRGSMLGGIQTLVMRAWGI